METEQIDSSSYMRILTEPGAGSYYYNIREYYKTGKPKLIGRSSGVIPAIFEGQQLTFFENGQKKSVKTFIHGKLTGTEYDYFPNGKPYVVKNYTDTTGSESAVLIIANYDSLGNALVTDGNGYYKAYAPDFKTVQEEGAVLNGKKNGVWKGREGNIAFTENYDNGKLISASTITPMGLNAAYSSPGITAPKFRRGGPEAFVRYLQASLKYPSSAARQKTEARVSVSFVIEKNGGISHITILRSPDEDITGTILNTLKDAPGWAPATKHGLPIRMLVDIPINFVKPGNGKPTIVIEQPFLRDMR